MNMANKRLHRMSGNRSEGRSLNYEIREKA